MLLVPSLNCNVCGQQCKDDPFDLKSLPVVCCQSGGLVCKNCSRGGYCGKCLKNCSFTTPRQIIVAIFLASMAAPEEVKLLDFGKWNPFICERCDTPFEYDGDRGLQACSCGYDLHCRKRHCSRDRHPRDQCKEFPKVSKCLMKVMEELRTYFKETAYVPVTNNYIGDSHFQAIEWLESNDIVSCVFCGECSLPTFTLTEDGRLICSSCERSNDTPTTRFGNYFPSLYFPRIQYILSGTDDLKQLTYSEWTPLRCSLCSVPFSEEEVELPVYHPECMKICCQMCSYELKCCDRKSSDWTTDHILVASMIPLVQAVRDAFQRIEQAAEFPLPMKEFQQLHARKSSSHIKLDSLICDICQNPCTYTFDRLSTPGVCANSGRLICGECSFNDCEQCDICEIRSPRQLLQAVQFTNLATVNEAKLLDFGKWNPFICKFCHIPFTHSGVQSIHSCTNPVYGVVHCKREACASKCILGANCESSSTVTNRLTKIMAELQQYFSEEEEEYRPVRNKSFSDRRIQALKALLKCHKCSGSGFQMLLTRDGTLICDKCCTPAEEEESISSKADYPFEHMFPDLDDLKLLTYSDWCPFRCAICATTFTDSEDGYPMYHPLCGTTWCKKCTREQKCEMERCQIPARFLMDIVKELQPYYKKEGSANEQGSNWLDGHRVFELNAQDIVINKDNILGNGVQAQVFKGIYGADEVAVKSFYRPKAGTSDEFLEELKHFVDLHHPNLLHLVGFVREERWIVLQYCPNKSLSEFIHDLGKDLNWQRLDKWTANIIEGMHYLHTNNLVHRDLKPDNILIDVDWSLQIGDFARSRRGKLTNTAYVTGNVGTKGYMAPDLISGHGYGRSVDVWSFGVILWEMCSRHRPFYGLDGEWVTEKLRNKQLTLPMLEPLPDEVNAVISSCLSFDPESRPSFRDIKWNVASASIRKNSRKWHEIAKQAHYAASSHRYELVRITENVFSSTGNRDRSHISSSYASTSEHQMHETQRQVPSSERAGQRVPAATRNSTVDNFTKGAVSVSDEPEPAANHTNAEEVGDSQGKMPWEWN